MSKSRDSNLDLLRATAILMVVGYHISCVWPIAYPRLKAAAELGEYGVILFFVLSGWLIGGIYWREHKSFGKVKLISFWMRRWLRTMPPYYVGMSLAYLAVYVARSDSFDWRYLCFLQNYDIEIPFYHASWSLCVEEHFYVLLPLIGAFLAYLPRKASLILVWGLPFLPPLLRVLDENAGPVSTFGYSRTATHLVFEGLAFGVAGAFTYTYAPSLWQKMQYGARFIVIPVLIIFFSIPWWGHNAVFYAGKPVAAFGSIIILASIAGSKPSQFASNSIVYYIAISSYSVYLTHTIAINIGRKLVVPDDNLFSEFISLLCWVVFILIFGGGFYLLIERGSLRLRDRIASDFSSVTAPYHETSADYLRQSAYKISKPASIRNE